jgi:predicted transcriptional regulator
VRIFLEKVYIVIKRLRDMGLLGRPKKKPVKKTSKKGKKKVSKSKNVCEFC